MRALLQLMQSQPALCTRDISQGAWGAWPSVSSSEKVSIITVHVCVLSLAPVQLCSSEVRGREPDLQLDFARVTVGLRLGLGLRLCRHVLESSIMLHFYNLPNVKSHVVGLP